MSPRRSKRLRVGTRSRPTYKEVSSSSDEDEDDDDSEDDGHDHDLMTLIHQAFTNIIENNPVSDPLDVCLTPDVQKMIMPDTSTLPCPPIHPTDLASLIQLCIACKRRKYRDCHRLELLRGPLEELQAMVGLTVIKQSIVDFILLHLQSASIQIPEMRHMIIAGPPGCGKTTISTVIAKILCKLGMCDTDRIVYGTQGNMIGGFLGQTAPKTEEVIRSAFGGVLVIDEASSLADGRSDQNSDSFSKSCVDTLNRMLSEHGEKFICILAGYKDEIYRDILSINPGMDRRFSTRFEIGTYTPTELREILYRHLDSRGITLDGTINLECMRTDKGLFRNGGGDCQLLADAMITAHAKRTFGRPDKNRLTDADIAAGFEVIQSRSSTATHRIPEAVGLMYT